jgi:hypothetical protein
MGQHIEAMPSSLTIRYAIKTKKAAENQLLFAYRVELEGIHCTPFICLIVNALYFYCIKILCIRLINHHVCGST